jgi:septum formation protein
MYTSEELILASASPRRRELLSRYGLSLKIVPADIDESVNVGEGPKELVTRLSVEKARSVAETYPDRWVLGADTTVWSGSAVLGKPLDFEDAVRMLESLSGGTHSVWGGFALVHLGKGIEHVEAHETQVEMTTLTGDMIAAYCATGEPFDKAGAYALQGIASCFVRRINGSHSNVIGIDVAAVLSTLQKYDAVRLCP